MLSAQAEVSRWGPCPCPWASGSSQRWFVERGFAHLHWFRRLRIRWEIRVDIHEAFLTLGCALICWRRLVSLP
ncbi:hypothetical protein GCM10010253_07950 [Streptomyces badius]|uniref:Transposase n=1 Tax=Streptomyces badius TaxID=1941 RepID=A0ABQ2SU98_STRBA|nr:hypothetical protein GCM10010253_07950 [Streptomyces badius]